MVGSIFEGVISGYVFLRRKRIDPLERPGRDTLLVQHIDRLRVASGFNTDPAPSSKLNSTATMAAITPGFL